MSRNRGLWAIATVFFISLMLRPPLAAIGPLLPQIQAGMHLSAAQLGLLTAIPVLCFGAGAFAGPGMLRRFGLARAFTILLTVMTITILTRVWFGFWYLLIATVAMGLGIALANVFFPALIRAEFPNSIPKMTAAYTTMLSGFSAVASGIAIPAAAALGSWQLALSLLAVPGVFSLFAWLITVRQTHPVAPASAATHTPVNIWRHKLTWAIAAFFGLQSSTFYVLLNWLPTMLIQQSMPALEAGGVVAFMSMIGIPIGMLITANLKRMKRLTGVVVAISVVTATGLALFLAGPPMALLAAVLTGVGLSSSFPLSLAIIALKGSNQATTTGLSSVSQGIGYLFSAAAVFAAGLSRELFGSWTPAMIALIIGALVQSIAGSYALKHPEI